MASVINTNMASLYAQKNLSGAQNALSTSVERLSSGLRINRAKDDAAGLGISEKIKSQVTSLNQGLRNANDAISMVQTAEGSLSEVSSILQRMKELSVQARNDSLSTTQRSFISDELVALKNEINSIAERTTFNDLSLLKNALRTQVAVPTAGDTSKLVNGTALLDGISVSNLKVNNTNTGTYTITTGTQTQISGQVSEASGNFGGSLSEVDKITIAGRFNTGDTITASVAITGGASITTTYTVSAADIGAGTSVANDVETRKSIAAGLAAALNSASQAATGDALGITAVDNVVYIGGRSDATTMTTTTTKVTSLDGSAATSQTNLKEVMDRYINLNEADAVEGNQFVLTVGNKEYSAVAGYGVSAVAIRNTIATRLTALLTNDFTGITHVDSGAGTDNTGQIKLAAASGLANSDVSLRVVRRVDGATVANQASTVSTASTTTANIARTITLQAHDIVEGRRAVVRIGNPEGVTEFSTVIGAADTKVTVAARLKDQINASHGNTSVGATAGVNDNVVSIAAGANFGMTNIALSFKETSGGSSIAAASSVSPKALARADRTITINQLDLATGNVVAVNIGSKEYAVKIANGDQANDIAYKLSQQIDDDYARVAGTVLKPAISTTLAGGTNESVSFVVAGTPSAGGSYTIAGLTFTVGSSAITATQLSEAFAGLAEGATTGSGTAYGTYSGTLTGYTTSATAGTTRVFTSTSKGNVADLAATVPAGAGTWTPTVTQGTAPTATEFADVTFDAADMTAGDSITLGGLTFTASRTVTRAEVAAAFANLSNSAVTGGGASYGVYTGALSGWTTGNATASGVTFTSTTATTDVANLELSSAVQRVDSGAHIRTSKQVTFATNGAYAATTSFTLGGLTVTVNGGQTASQDDIATAFANLTAGATTGGGNLTKLAYSGTLGNYTTGAASGANVTFTQSSVDTTELTFSGTGTSPAIATTGGNTITLGAGSNLGRENISVSVKKITDPGKITITANADTGIGGTKQSIDVGTIAAGSAKSFDFDNLGVSFTLNNTRASAVNSASFEAFTPKANTLAVQSAMNGEALFQVGAGTRDNVVLDGFKDIRITGQNKNTGSEKEVFDKINETLTTIAANTTESLSTANFATLENRIEDAITMVSDFRSYFGGQQNRIEFAISNIQAQSENLTAANSRIVDTDYAAETANLTKTQIMQQAATAMLAQANQMPNVILALLK